MTLCRDTVLRNARIAARCTDHVTRRASRVVDVFFGVVRHPGEESANVLIIGVGFRESGFAESHLARIWIDVLDSLRPRRCNRLNLAVDGGTLQVHWVNIERASQKQRGFHGSSLPPTLCARLLSFLTAIGVDVCYF